MVDSKIQDYAQANFVLGAWEFCSGLFLLGFAPLAKQEQSHS
jgi:hypothetical protein